MAKVKLGTAGFLYPMPIVIIGADVDGKPNYMTVAWVTRTNYSPPMIGMALGKTHQTNKGIREHGEFSVNVPSADLMRITDYMGIVSGSKIDKSGFFECVRGDLTHAPMVNECPLTMECRLNRTIDLPTNEFFIGEIVAVHADERILTEGTPDIRKMQPFGLTMPDNQYWAIGDMIGKAWQSGKGFTKS